MSFVANAEIVALPKYSYLTLLRTAPAIGVFGGRTYDAVIAECAIQAKAATLLTLNESHFRNWESDRLKIIVPGMKNP